jgi:hypothetical protein
MKDDIPATPFERRQRIEALGVKELENTERGILTEFGLMVACLEG